ncbi:proline-rich receptor-like protein kinase PERK8 [Triticum urartu]|uniref:proline-rich receptor-like protein kinase PERK8 n=1 Tax=Triticum urartu TaxID=4572 RepID=UPI0020449372|nr:proline-rich receptor-like protein kinase PERK8 [Triticum urartu]
MASIRRFSAEEKGKVPLDMPALLPPKKRSVHRCDAAEMQVVMRPLCERPPPGSLDPTSQQPCSSAPEAELLQRRAAPASLPAGDPVLRPAPSRHLFLPFLLWFFSLSLTSPLSLSHRWSPWRPVRTSTTAASYADLNPIESGPHRPRRRPSLPPPSPAPCRPFIRSLYFFIGAEPPSSYSTPAIRNQLPSSDPVETRRRSLPEEPISLHLPPFLAPTSPKSIAPSRWRLNIAAASALSVASSSSLDSSSLTRSRASVAGLQGPAAASSLAQLQLRPTRPNAR